ncbi:hypothetical protein [Hymenobacter sp. CRA2]|uniref:hypothetical protein n=1 Tax=Hymenobacter sp. CRA2 TaxID=1955620 RepID=UPI00098E9297|nr:hypothetical protein [Hymenobacter sp. CRA2]OON67801.1 hypothetical protein B0919_16585 [Hymenobacter sp. CRA2]
MKQLEFLDGGRPLNSDDLVVLQDEIYDAVNGQLTGLLACVVAGCEVSVRGNNQYDINPGLVYIDGEIKRFSGASNVTLPQELYADAYQTTEQRPYQTGGSKATMGEAVVLARAYDAATPGEKVLVTADGALRVNKARERQWREVAEIGLMADFGPYYDSTGKGRYGTPAYGWALCNGNNNTPNMAGQFPVGFGTGGALGSDYNATRKTGGAREVTLTEEQMPKHTHLMDSAGAHTHTYTDRFGAEENETDAGGNRRRTLDTTVTKTTSTAGNHYHVIQEKGDSQPFDNRPPFTVLAFRMWVSF